LVYAHLGYDPQFAELSPGTVLHVEAMRLLYAEERFRAFDFTEGDGAHKAQFGRASVACADVLILRPTLRNRAALAAMRGVDGLAASGKNILDRVGMRGKVKALIRR
jgi:CelD/BcsL family acetyltransferase involved in cellulose biosynthesis